MPATRSASAALACGLISSVIACSAFGQAASAPAAPPLKTADSFASISDADARARALFTEAGKVILSPRCVNCHPAGERPTQGEDMHPHQPWVVRGADDKGAIGLRCTTCHQAANFDPANLPGHPKWHVAPIEMAWQNRTLGQICQQIKDPARNGGKTMPQILEHMAHDSLVGWGWNPGGNRIPAAGTQGQFGELIGAWMKAGAACPA